MAAPPDGARLKQARAQIMAFTERLVLENLASDYRRGRDPSETLQQLLRLQDLKKKMGIEGTSPFIR